MKKSLLILSLVSLSLTSCLEIKKKEEIIKCVVTSCEEIEANSIHEEMNRPLGYRLETSCGRSFRTKAKYQAGDTIEVTKVSYQ
jgi:hypothetical protein